MPSTVNPEDADPHDIFVIEPEVLRQDRVVLAARVEPPFAATPPAAKEVGPVRDIMGDILSRPSTPTPRVAPDVSVAAPVTPSTPAPPVDLTFRASAATTDAIANEIKPHGEIGVPDDVLRTGAQRSRGAWVKRAAFGFVFTLCSAVAAEAWNHYGHTARDMLAQWTPALTLPSSQPAATPPTAEAQPALAAAPAAGQPAPDNAAATAAATPPSVPSVTQDIAAMAQQIEALKASVAQLKAGQEQMAQQIQRDLVRNAVARTSEIKPAEARTSEHPRVLGAPPRPLQPPPRKPPQAAYTPPPPSTAAAMNLAPPYSSRPPVTAAPAPMPPPDSEAPDGGPVVRPPMPLH